MRLVNAQPQDPTGINSSYGSVFAGIVSVAAVAAQNSHAQLSATSAGGYGGLVIAAMVSLATAGDIVVCSYPTPLATNLGLGHCTNLASTTGTLNLRSATNAGILGTQIERLSLPASQSVNVITPYQYTVAPNTTLLIAAVTVNIAMTVTFRWIEANG